MPRTKKANTPRRERMHEEVERSAKARGASPGSAARQANAAVKKDVERQKRKKRS